MPRINHPRRRGIDAAPEAVAYPGAFVRTDAVGGDFTIKLSIHVEAHLGHVIGSGHIGPLSWREGRITYEIVVEPAAVAMTQPYLPIGLKIDVDQFATLAEDGLRLADGLRLEHQLDGRRSDGEAHGSRKVHHRALAIEA